MEQEDLGLEQEVGPAPELVLGEANNLRDPDTLHEAGPTAPLSPASRPTTAAFSQAEDAEQPSASAITTEPETLAGGLDAPNAASNAAPVGHSPNQAAQQTVEADTSEILGPSQHDVPGEIGQSAHQEGQDIALDRTAVTDQAEAVGVPSNSANAAAVEPELAVSAGQPPQNEPALSGQEEAAFAHATFIVPTENWKHLQSVPLATTAAEIKQSLCSNWNIAETALSVKYNQQELHDNQSLHSCGIQV